MERLSEHQGYEDLGGEHFFAIFLTAQNACKINFK